MSAAQLPMLAALYSPPKRTEVQVTREVHDACRALATTTTAWLSFLPTPAAVASARSTTTGLARLLTELASMQRDTTI